MIESISLLCQRTEQMGANIWTGVLTWCLLGHDCRNLPLSGAYNTFWIKRYLVMSDSILYYQDQCLLLSFICKKKNRLLYIYEHCFNLPRQITFQNCNFRLHEQLFSVEVKLSMWNPWKLRCFVRNHNEYFKFYDRICTYFSFRAITFLGFDTFCVLE